MNQSTPCSTILAVDLGKFRRVACLLESHSGEHRYLKLDTTPAAVHDLLVEHEPDRVVIEIGSQAGWICDLCGALGIEVQVANTAHDAWKWKNTRRKTDKDDALKLAQLSSMGQLPTIVVPVKKVRQWRALIGYRTSLVRRRTMVKNHVRTILDRESLRHPAGPAGWNEQGLRALGRLAMPPEACGPEELWRGMLTLELTALAQVQGLVAELEAKLSELAAADERVAQLRTIPGVGPRLAEAVVAVIDDPHRFKSAKQVGAYAGLVPRQYESGQSQRQGRITGCGHGLLRTLLVEVAWLARQHNPWVRGVYEQTMRGSATRKKIAVVAAGRRLLIVCWAMLRDGTT